MSTPTQESSTSNNTASLSDITPATILGRRRGATRMMAVLVAAGAGLLLIVSGLTDVGLFGSAAVAATLLVFGLLAPRLATPTPAPWAQGRLWR